MNKYVLAITSSLFFLVLSLFITIDSVHAQYYCDPPPDYCAGQVANSVPNGCRASGGSCVYTFTTVFSSCDGNCVVSYPYYPAGVCHDNDPGPGASCSYQGPTYGWGPVGNRNCCVNSGGPGGPGGSCNGNGECDGDENWQNCPSECPLPDLSMCGQDCNPGNADCDQGGPEFSCDNAVLHCSTGDAGNPCNGKSPGDPCTGGGHCMYVCWSQYCGASAQNPSISGNVYSAPNHIWANNPGTTIDAVPMVLINSEDPSQTYTDVTESNGAYGISSGGLIGVGRDENFDIIPLWTRNNTLDIYGFPFAPPGHKGPARTFECDDDERCGGQSGNGFQYTNQPHADFDAGVGLYYGNGCDAIHYYDNPNFYQTGNNRREHCDFFYAPLLNQAPKGTTQPVGGGTMYADETKNITLNVTDVDGNLRDIDVYIQKTDDATGSTSWQAPYIKVADLGTLVGTPGCSASACNATVQLNFNTVYGSPSNAPGGRYEGNWVVFFYATDSTGPLINNPETGGCAGTPGVTSPTSYDLPPGFLHCDLAQNDNFDLVVNAPLRDITGSIRLVTLNGNSCIDAGPLDTTAYMPADQITVTYDPTIGANVSNTITTGSNYAILNTLGYPGTLSVNRAILRHPTISTVQYNFRCFNGTRVATGTTVNIPNFSGGDLTNQNFGYELFNPYTDAWITGYNGNIYTQSISELIPPAPGGTLTPFLATYAGTNDTVLYGLDLNNVGVSVRARPDGSNNSKHINLFGGEFWDEGFSFTPPAGTTTKNANQLINANGNGNVQIGEVYQMSRAQFNNFLNSNNANAITYNLKNNDNGATSGVAVLYVTAPNSNVQPLNIVARGANNIGIQSASPNKRLLVISQVPFRIRSDVGHLTTAVPANLQTQRAHVEMGIISRGEIEFEKVASGDDRVIIMEGPLVSANGNINSTASIDMRRNLNLYNGLYPALIVRRNPVYMQTALNSGIYQSTVYYKLVQ